MLEILCPSPEGNGFGEEERAWESMGCIPAERVKLSGSASGEAGDAFAAYMTQWNVHDCDPVEEQWRVREKGTSVLYTVTAVIPNAPRGMKTLICVRVNE